jgi:hypothetical protein
VPSLHHTRVHSVQLARCFVSWEAGHEG